MRRRLIPVLTVLVLTLAVPVFAQQSASVEDDTAVLMADSVFITPDRVLIAEGNVEALHGDIRLTANRITFDRASGRLSIEGPIRIDEGDNTTILASAAELDRDLQNGLLNGARMVMNQQLQLAAVQMNRVDGRFTQLYKTAVTSCQVCTDGRPPLWQIRARKVIHDKQKQQLYFEGAQFRVRGTTVLRLPRFRLPDPTVKRARGFLVPSIRTTNKLGTGVRLPYFIPLGDHRDLTLTPYLSTSTRTLGFRYRQLFQRGRIQFEGAYTNDDLTDESVRGYLFGTGHFDLNHGFKLNFDIKTTTDNAYLVDYGLPDYDRLKNEIALSRYNRDTAFRAEVVYFDSLRDQEAESTLPNLIPSVRYERRWFPKRVGGEMRLGLDVQGHHRSSSENVLGRDVTRATADLSWRRDWRFSQGVRADWRIGLATDLFEIYQDDNFDHHLTRVTPSTALTLRYPMMKTTASGVIHALEPVVQLGWTSVHGSTPPSDESAFVEFDEGNLLSLSRFPAPDRREDGLTLVYGLNWSRFAPSGWQASASVGQVFRRDADPDFTRTSGLSGTASDVLVAGKLQLERGVALTARALLDGSFKFSKAELRGNWSAGAFDLAGTYLWQDDDEAEGRTEALSEIWFDGRYEINPNWSARASMRYDITETTPTRAGLGVGWQNECVTVDLSVNRRYTSSTSVEPTTDFGFTIALRGFAVDGGTEKYRRSCS
ncbi:LPS-assembly protein LptD [Pontibaca salina]|uniref:LPS-assembly protein LptD n=1 Tax=Pontibaca salina TaxID=2795731 RepID=A0A934HQU6_9RHOB|nr:LPS assembly protein LptD [Pontibaca salina]MBI6629782.1 LPS-assembly protein LptD [Pontibaca salina]